MIDEKIIIEIIKQGRLNCYVKKSPEENPYNPGQIYNWEFEMPVGRYLYTDSYRGFNPYSGVEYIKDNDPVPIWSCDYVGYAKATDAIPEEQIYNFLKRTRGSHLSSDIRNFFHNYSATEGDLDYLSAFSGDLKGLLQTEEIFYRGILVFRQVSAGRLTLERVRG